MDQCGLHCGICVELVCQSVFDGSFHIPRESYGEKRHGLCRVSWCQLCVTYLVFELVSICWCAAAMGANTSVLYCGSHQFHFGQNSI